MAMPSQQRGPETRSTPVAAASDSPSSEPFPLTEAQREIWLAAHMGGSAALAYNESLKFEYRGVFDAELFGKALEAVAKRHPILLATISPDGRSQQIHNDRKIKIPIVDLAGMSDDAKQRQLSDLTASAAWMNGMRRIWSRAIEKFVMAVSPDDSFSV